MEKFFSTSSSKQAGRYIIIVLGVCFFLSGSFFAASEWLIRVYVASSTFFLQRAELFHARPYINTVFGDSQMRDGINMMPGFANYSAGSQRYADIEAKIYKYYANETKPFKVILQASINNYNAGRDSTVSQDTLDFYVDDARGDILIFKQYFRETAYKYWKNYFSHGFKIVARTGVMNEDGSTTKYGRYDQESEKTKKNRALIDLNRYRPVEDVTTTHSYKALRSMLDFLKNKPATVCLVALPLEEHARKLFMKDENVLRVLQMYRAFEKEYGYRFVNYMDKPFPDRYFHDPSHLNEEGAKFLTRSVYRDCFQ